MATKIRGATALTGGGAGAVDAISGAVLADGDIVMAVYDGQVYTYVVDADSGLAESSPHIIAPDVSAGDKRLILQSMSDEIDVLAIYGDGVNRTRTAIEAAKTALGAVNKYTLLIRRGTWTIDDDLTITSNLTLKVVPGALLQIATGKTLTIGGTFEAGLYQIFSLTETGKVVFAATSCADLYPQWWGAVGDGTADDTEAVRAGAIAMLSSTIPLTLVGTYKITSTIYLGNTVATQSLPIRIRGNAARGAVIKVIDPAMGAAIWIGGYDDTHRYDGKAVIENIIFNGPENYGFGKGSYGLQFWGAQGITIKGSTIQGWQYGIYAINTDLVNIIEKNWIRKNDKGIFVTAVGGSATTGGGSNSWYIAGNIIIENNNSGAGIGIDFNGGISPNILGNNFVQNDIDIALSVTTAFVAVVSTPVVRGNYSEGALYYSMQVGSGNGIVQGGEVAFNDIFSLPATAKGIWVGNADTYTRIYDNNIAGTAGFTAYEESAGSAGYGVSTDYRPGGTTAGAELYYTKARGYVSHGMRHRIPNFNLAAAATEDLITLPNSPATPWAGLVTIRGTKTGAATLSTWYVILLGGSNPVINYGTPLHTLNYTGGGVLFSIAQTDTGAPNYTSKLVLTNNEGADTLAFEVTIMDFGLQTFITTIYP